MMTKSMNNKHAKYVFMQSAVLKYFQIDYLSVFS